MTAIIKGNVKTKLCDREDYVDQKIKLENQEEQPGQQKHWKRKRTTEIRARRSRLKRTKTGIVFDRDALMDKEQRLAERAQELQEQKEEAIPPRRRLPKLQTD